MLGGYCVSLDTKKKHNPKPHLMLLQKALEELPRQNPPRLVVQVKQEKWRESTNTLKSALIDSGGSVNVEISP